MKAKHWKVPELDQALVDAIGQYWNGGKKDTLTDSESLDLAITDINRLIAHFTKLTDKISQLQQQHDSLVEQKRRFSNTYGELLKRVNRE